MKKHIIALSTAVLLSFISFAQEKLIPVHRDVKYGYAFTEDGPLILPARYDDALYFEEGLAPVKMGEKWGFINEQGVTVIPFKFDYANIFTDGYALVGAGSNGQYKYGLINKTGVVVIPMKYDGLGDVSEGLIAVIVGNKLGFMNIKGVMIIPLKFDIGPSGQAADFVEGHAKIGLGKKYEYIDKTGKVLTAPKYSAGADFKEGMAMVGVDTNWDKKNSDWSKETTAWGFIDATGKEVLPCKYEHVSNFENGFGQAQLDGYTYKIDKTGKIVDTISKPAPKRVIAYDSTTYSGKINKMGRIMIMYNGYIKSVTLNDEAIKNIYKAPIEVDIKKLGLKAGSKATLKIVYNKGTKVWFVGGQGIE